MLLLSYRDSTDGCLGVVSMGSVGTFVVGLSRGDSDAESGKGLV